MISVNEAKQLLAQHIVSNPASNVVLMEALGLVLAHDIKSDVDVPSFNNSAMDGYAFQFHSETTNYKITQKIQAGDYFGTILKRGEAAWIFTGAPLPQGADTVIQQERCSVTNGIVIFDVTKIRKGANVRLQGAQNITGDVIAKIGSRVTVGMIGLLASGGIQTVAVFAPPSVGLIVTGNELQQPGEALSAGHIYNSNEPTVKAYLNHLGIKKCKSFLVKDEIDLLKEKVKQCLAQFDVVILTGGISVGEYDYVQEVLADEGVQPLFYKVKQKPGKPLFVGKKNNLWVFALPGNPAAVITSFNQYVKPCLWGMMGCQNTFEPDSILPLTNEWEKKGTLTHFLKAKKTNKDVTILSGQDSFNMLPFGEVNCFVVMDESTDFLPAGNMVNVYDF